MLIQLHRLHEGAEQALSVVGVGGLGVEVGAGVCVGGQTDTQKSRKVR